MGLLASVISLRITHGNPHVAGLTARHASRYMTSGVVLRDSVSTRVAEVNRITSTCVPSCGSNANTAAYRLRIEWFGHGRHSATRNPATSQHMCLMNPHASCVTACSSRPTAEEAPSEAYLFLQDAYDRMNCDYLSADEQLEELLNLDMGLDDLERLSAAEDSPLSFGPAGIGTVLTLGAVREPRSQDDVEVTLARLSLASRALLDSLPEEVPKMGTREPTATEDAAMRVASAPIALGDGLISDTPDGDEQFQEVMDELPFLEQELNFACILKYEDGASERTRKRDEVRGKVLVEMEPRLAPVL